MKKLDYNAIQKEIHRNHSELKDGTLDVYEFISRVSKKYFKPVDEMWGERTDDNPYVDMLFGMLEINGIELY
jgi:hypothetical protein